MAHNTKKLATDVDGKAIPQYYNAESDSYEVLTGKSGASKVIAYDEDGEVLDFGIQTVEILDKLNDLTGTAMDEEHRKANESNRETAEQNRVASEQNRETTEQNRDASEILRETTESQRDASEGVRQENEQARESAESVRVANEDERVANEQARELAESDRATMYSEVIAGRTSTVTGDSYSTIGKRLDEMETMTVLENHKAYFEIKDGRPRLRLEEI